MKDWYLKKLSELQKRYWKVGNQGEIAGSTEESIKKLLDHILTYGLYAIVALFILYKQIAIEGGVQIIALAGVFFSSVAFIFSTISKFGAARIAKKRMDQWFVKKKWKCV